MQSTAEAIRGAIGHRRIVVSLLDADSHLAIRGDQRQSEAIRGNPRQSKAIQGTPRQAETIRGNPRQSKVIRGNQRTLTLATFI